jgi:mRNA interferase RelE/StbE
MIVILRKSASREIAGLPEEYYSRVKKSILSLGDDRYPHGCKKLTGRELFWIRVGPSRIVYEIDKRLIRHRRLFL